MGTFIVGAIVFIGIALAVKSVYKSRKSGGCGCDCNGCDDSNTGDCH